MARLLEPEIFGIIAILLVITSIADSISQSGLGLALIQKKDTTTISFDTAFWLSLILALLLYGLIFACAPAIALFYEMNELKDLLRTVGLIVVFNSVNSIQRSRLQKKFEFKTIFIVSVFAAFVSGCIGITLAYLSFGAWALVALSLIQAICVSLGLSLLGRWLPQVSFSLEEAKELFSFGWKVGMTGILNVFYGGVSELIIGKTCSPSDLGYYSQGTKYPSAALGVLNNSVANVLFPAFSAIANNRDKLIAAISKSLKLGTFLTFPIAILCVVVAKPLITILLGEVWLPCVLVFQLVCLSNCLTIVQLVNLRAYMALGESALYLRLQIIKVLVGGVIICGTVILSRDIYITGFAVCLVGISAVLLVDLHPAQRILGYGRFMQIKDISNIIFAALVPAALAFLPQLFISGDILLLLIEATVYFFAFLILAKMTCRTELFEVRAIVRSLFKKEQA